MANFSDFIKNNNVENIDNNDNKNNFKSNTNSKQSNENLEDLIDKYSKYSSNDLMNEFLKLTIEKKKNGQLKDDELNELSKSILPFLDEDQKKNLGKILNVVRNV